MAGGIEHFQEVDANSVEMSVEESKMANFLKGQLFKKIQKKVNNLHVGKLASVEN